MSFSECLPYTRAINREILRWTHLTCGLKLWLLMSEKIKLGWIIQSKWLLHNILQLFWGLDTVCIRFWTIFIGSEFRWELISFQCGCYVQTPIYLIFRVIFLFNYNILSNLMIKWKINMIFGKENQLLAIQTIIIQGKYD